MVATGWHALLGGPAWLRFRLGGTPLPGANHDGTAREGAGSKTAQHRVRSCGLLAWSNTHLWDTTATFLLQVLCLGLIHSPAQASHHAWLGRHTTMTSQPAAPSSGSVDRSKDPIWSTPVAETRHEEVGSWTSTVNSPRCGGWYSIHDSIAAKIKNWSGQEKARLTSRLIKERQSRTECPKVTEGMIERVEKQKDMPPSERADAILKYLKSKTHKLGESIICARSSRIEKLISKNESFGRISLTDEDKVYYNLLAYSESSEPFAVGEIKFLLEHLRERNWIKYHEYRDKSENKISCQLTVDGYTKTVDSYTKLDDYRIKKLLQEEAWDSVAAWKVETGEDPFNEPAIWVWVILESSQRFEQRDKIRRRVLEIIADLGETRWVYVQFRTKHEQEELDDLERQEALEAAQEVSA